MYSPGCKDGAPARPLYHALAAWTRTLSRASSRLIIGNSCVALLPVTKTPPGHPACREMPIRTAGGCCAVGRVAQCFGPSRPRAMPVRAGEKAVPAAASWSGHRTPRQDDEVGTQCSERCACADRARAASGRVHHCLHALAWRALADSPTELHAGGYAKSRVQRALGKWAIQDSNL